MFNALHREVGCECTSYNTVKCQPWQPWASNRSLYRPLQFPVLVVRLCMPVLFSMQREGLDCRSVFLWAMLDVPNGNFPLDGGWCLLGGSFL